jgi:hypothetical protein
MKISSAVVRPRKAVELSDTLRLRRPVVKTPRDTLAKIEIGGGRKERERKTYPSEKSNSTTPN